MSEKANPQATQRGSGQYEDPNGYLRADIIQANATSYLSGYIANSRTALRYDVPHVYQPPIVTNPTFGQRTVNDNAVMTQGHMYPDGSQLQLRKGDFVRHDMYGANSFIAPTGSTHDYLYDTAKGHFALVNEGHSSERRLETLIAQLSKLEEEQARKSQMKEASDAQHPQPDYALAYGTNGIDIYKQKAVVTNLQNAAAENAENPGLVVGHTR
jgi:hypothetical protein